jgi:hypothetical protein
VTNCVDSTRIVRPLFQEVDGGLIPTSTLQLVFGAVPVPVAMSLNALWHSRLPVTVRGNIDRNTHKVCYAAEYGGLFYAVAIWSTPVAGKELTKSEDWLELRRFAISGDAPKNTATRMLGWMVRDIKRRFPSIKRLISYQDTDVHGGVIYKASGWSAAHRVTDTNWGLRRSPSGRKRNTVVAPGVKVRWEKAIADHRKVS